MDQIPQIIQTVLTVGGGAWLFNWLKDVVKETFKKIDQLEKDVFLLKEEKRIRKEIESEFQSNVK